MCGGHHEGIQLTTTSAISSSYTTRAELLSTFDGDVAFVESLVVTFADRWPVLIGEILAALEAGDAGAVSRAAHSLKGSIGYFENGELSATASRVERITAAELSLVPSLVAQLEQRLSDLTRYLNAEFPS